MLEHRRFAIKEQIKFLKSHHTYDIFDGESGESIGVADETIGLLNKIGRWFISKQLMPTRVEVREKPDDSLVFSLNRGIYIFRSRVEIHDGQGSLIGYLKSKLISWSGGFYIYDKRDRVFGEVKGNLIGFNYRVVTPDGGVELGRVSKKWTSIVQELFTSSDTYMVEVNEDLDDQPIAKMLVLSAALAIDMIFKSESNTAGNDMIDSGE